MEAPFPQKTAEVFAADKGLGNLNEGKSYVHSEIDRDKQPRRGI
jgi:hypothetical protein